jgi:hypothetical protein
MNRRSLFVAGFASFAGCTSPTSSSGDGAPTSSTGAGGLNSDSPDSESVSIGEPRFEYISQVTGTNLIVPLSSELEEQLQVLAVDSNGNTIDSQYIARESMLDGRDSAQLKAGNMDSGDEITIQVVIRGRDGESPEIAATKSITVPTADFRIAKVETEVDALSRDSGYWISAIEIQLNNTGGLPVRANSAKMEFGGTEDFIGAVDGISGSVIQPGDSGTLSAEFFQEIFRVEELPADGQIIVNAQDDLAATTTFEVRQSE